MNDVSDSRAVERAAKDADPRADAAFRRWFGASEAADSTGRPLMLFHGTAADITSFRGMVWASCNQALANEYAAMRNYRTKSGAVVMPLYMRIERPLDGDALPRDLTVKTFFAGVLEQAVSNGIAVSEDLRNEVSDLMHTAWYAARREESGPSYDAHSFWNETTSLFGRDGAEAIRKLFVLLGFDGIKLTEQGSLTFGVFTSAQAKSAIANKGGFDIGSAGITESLSMSPMRRFMALAEGNDLERP